MSKEHSGFDTVFKSTSEADCTHITPNSIFMDNEMERAKERFLRPPYYLLCK